MHRYSTSLAAVFAIAALAAGCGDDPVQGAADPARSMSTASGSRPRRTRGALR